MKRNRWKWKEIDENGKKMMKMKRNRWKWKEIDENEKKQIKWKEIDENGKKKMKMERNGWKWIKADGGYSKNRTLTLLSERTFVRSTLFSSSLMSQNSTLKCNFSRWNWLGTCIAISNEERNLRNLESEQVHIVSIAQWEERSIWEYSRNQTWKRNHNFQFFLAILSNFSLHWYKKAHRGNYHGN